MSELAFERQAMVERQLRKQGIHDERVLTAMTRVPRHVFLPQPQWNEAYSPRAVHIGHGQTISQPFIVAAMTQLLELEGDEIALEIGTGSGYQAAILGVLAGGLVTVERIPALAREAARALARCGMRNVQVVVADGSTGVPMRAIFDRIVVTAAAPAVPEALLGQLADPGILVCPVGDRHLQELHVIRREGGRDHRSTTLPCRFVPLVGDGGWVREEMV